MAGEHSQCGEGLVVASRVPERLGQFERGPRDHMRVPAVGLRVPGQQLRGPAHGRAGQVGDRDPHVPRRSLAVQEWRAAMENRPPFLDDGRERHPENLSTHDMERLVSEAFAIAANLNSAADDDEYRAAMSEGLHTFDMLRERYGLTQDGLWITATDMNESQRTLIHCP